MAKSSATRARTTSVTESGVTVLAVYTYDALSRRTNLAYGNGTTQAFGYSTGGDLLTLAHNLSGTSATYTNSYTKAHQLLTEVASNAAWQYLPAVFEATTYSPANALNQYVAVTQGANPTVTLFYDANGRSETGRREVGDTFYAGAAVRPLAVDGFLLPGASGVVRAYRTPFPRK